MVYKEANGVDECCGTCIFPEGIEVRPMPRGEPAPEPEPIEVVDDPTATEVLEERSGGLVDTIPINGEGMGCWYPLDQVCGNDINITAAANVKGWSMIENAQMW